MPAETTVAAYVDKNWKAPRTSWGHPSLEGVWRTDHLRGVPMNRPEKIGLRETLTQEEFLARASTDETGRDFAVNVGTFLRHEFGIRSFGYSSLIVDPPNGQMPKLTPAGEALAATRVRGTFGPGPFDGFQRLHTLRPLHHARRARLAVARDLRQWSAHRTEPGLRRDQLRNDPRHTDHSAGPRARRSTRACANTWASRAVSWEGDTLVVETTNFTDRTSIGVNGGGPPNSEQLKLTERFTRVDPEMIEYRVTVNDPGAYTAPFTMRLMITSRPGYEMYEYSCHEGNGAVANALSGERVYEKQVAEAKARGLPIPARAVEHDQIRNGVPEEGARSFNINKGE